MRSIVPRDITSLDLNLLKVLDALLDERSVTRAADRLGLTQPGVSGMLNRLRDSLGDPLFVRTRRGVVPTARAQELAAPVKHVLDGIEALLQPPSFDPAKADLTVAIAATDYALRAVMMPFLATLRRRAPGIRVAARPIVAGLVQDQLERGEIDLALVTPDAVPPDLHTRALFEEHYVCVMRHDHPDAAAGHLTLDRFCALDHALVSYAGDGFRGATDTALARMGRQRRVVLSVSSFIVLPDILRVSDLVAMLPSRLMSGIDGLAVFPPPLDVPGFTKIAAWHDRTHRDPGHRWLRSVMFDAVP